MHGNHLIGWLCICAVGDEVYDDFAATYGRRHSTPEEYEHRRQVFHDNRKFIEDWNSEAHNSESHMLALNHFADWTQVCICHLFFWIWHSCRTIPNIQLPEAFTYPISCSSTASADIYRVSVLADRVMCMCTTGFHQPGLTFCTHQLMLCCCRRVGMCKPIGELSVGTVQQLCPQQRPQHRVHVHNMMLYTLLWVLLCMLLLCMLLCILLNWLLS